MAETTQSERDNLVCRLAEQAVAGGRVYGPVTIPEGTAVLAVLTELEQLRSFGNEAVHVLTEVWKMGNSEGRLAQLWNLAGCLDAILNPDASPRYVPDELAASGPKESLPGNPTHCVAVAPEHSDSADSGWTIWTRGVPSGDYRVAWVGNLPDSQQIAEHVAAALTVVCHGRVATESFQCPECKLIFATKDDWDFHVSEAGREIEPIMVPHEAARN